MNKVILVGIVGSDAELKYTQGGTAIAKFRMATSRKRNGAEDTQWHNIVVFGKSAENLTQYLVKGKQVGVDGHIEYRTYDKPDGSKGYQTDILAEDIQLLGGGQQQHGRQQRQHEPHAATPSRHVTGYSYDAKVLGVTATPYRGDANDSWGLGPDVPDDTDVPL